MKHGMDFSTLEQSAKVQKLELFKRNIEALSEADQRYMTLDTIAGVLEVDLCDRELMDYVRALMDNELLTVKAQYVDARDGVHEFSQKEYRRAKELGYFTDPSTGLAVEDTSLLAPFWSLPESMVTPDIHMTA